MIINLDREPKYSLYYIGSVILDEMKKTENISIEVLYRKVCSKVDDNLPIDFLYYSLDWLYLLSLIKVEENRVLLC